MVNGSTTRVKSVEVEHCFTTVKEGRSGDGRDGVKGERTKVWDRESPGGERRGRAERGREREVLSERPENEQRQDRQRPNVSKLPSLSTPPKLTITTA
ncbi:hypothetical protein J6590_087404 [Homalodisca vitripennis]|nr:hypothetical protein J6590_087404 [Homalodisca vitripennis]